MDERKVALIDLDGTLADFHGELTRQLADLAAPGDPSNLDFSDEKEWPAWLRARSSLIKRQPGFWRNLPRIEDGFGVVRLLQELNFSISVLTKGPWKTTSAWTEKVEWCAEHLPDVQVTITHDKSNVYGRVLFDDFPGYILPWLKHRPRGHVLMLDQPWNRGFSHPQVRRILRPFLKASEIEEYVTRAQEG